MTELTKPVARRACRPFAHYRRRIVVILEPGDVIAMRLERARLTYRASLAQVFCTLAEWHAEAERRRRREARTLRTAL